jgi:hypothetical protein
LPYPLGTWDTSADGPTPPGVASRVTCGIAAGRRPRAMTTIGTKIDETGTLIRDGGAFYLRRDMGGRYELELHRTPVDLVEKRVRLVGTLVGDDLVNADGVSPV